MTHIKLTQEAYLDGYDGAFYRFNDEEGDELSTGLWDYWYEARAKDEDGEEYTVIWKITNQEAWENGDEAYACEWSDPTYIEDHNGFRVTDDVILDC